MDPENPEARILTEQQRLHKEQKAKEKRRKAKELANLKAQKKKNKAKILKAKQKRVTRYCTDIVHACRHVKPVLDRYKNQSDNLQMLDIISCFEMMANIGRVAGLTALQSDIYDANMYNNSIAQQAVRDMENTSQELVDMLNRFKIKIINEYQIGSIAGPSKDANVEDFATEKC